MSIEKCHDCSVKPGELHKTGCDWEVCFLCGRQLISCYCSTEERERIPFGTVREIAARIPYYHSELIERNIKQDLLDAISKGLW